MERKDGRLIFDEGEVNLLPELSAEMPELEAGTALQAIESRISSLRQRGLEMGLSPYVSERGAQYDIQTNVQCLVRTQQQLQRIVEAQEIVSGFERLLTEEPKQ
jgi:hypothetical protein